MTEKNRGPYRKRLPRTCIVVGCAGVFYAKGLCRGHWARWRRTGDLELRPRGRIWTKEEDFLILSIPTYPSGQAKHRAVIRVAEKLGRTILSATERRSRLLTKKRLENPSVVSR